MSHGEEVMKWNSNDDPLNGIIQSPQKIGSTKSATNGADVNFDVWYPKCSCVIPLHSVKLWMHSITSQFCSYVQNWLTMLERNIQNQLKMPPAYAIKGNARAHSTDTAKSVLWHWGVGSVTPSLFSWPQSMWLQSDSQNWRSICIRNNFQTKIIILTAIWCKVAQNSTSGDINGVCHFLHH